MSNAANDVADSIKINGVVVRRLGPGTIVFEDVNGTTVRADSNVALTALYERIKATQAK